MIHYHMVVDKLDTTFAALSDPTRRAMIERLSHGPASVHGLTEPFALSQQMISKHIAYLMRVADCEQDEAWTRECVHA